MVAAVETMMWSGAVPWHGLGVDVGKEPIIWQEAITKAGLDWSVALQPLFAQDPNGAYLPVSTHKRVARESDNKTLGIVSNRYTPIQNEDAFKFLNDLIISEELRFETAGALMGGKKVFMLARMKDSFFVKGLAEEEITPYLLLSNSHDGSSKCVVKMTFVRVVCFNTLSMALGRSGREYGIIHRGIHSSEDLDKERTQAQDVLGLANESVQKFATTATMLSDVGYSEDALEGYLMALVPDPEDPKTNNTRAVNIRNQIRRNLNDFPGSDTEAAQGTYWGLLNAATAYGTFQRTVRSSQADARARSVLMGTAASFNQRALDIAVTMASAT